MTPRPPRIDTPAAFSSAFDVSRETLEKLEAYAALLRRWQSKMNLVAPATLDEVWHRHLADSAQLMAEIPPATQALFDLGSGAGFPGLVLAILSADHPTAVRRGPSGQFAVTLVESDSRKAAFLRDAARTVAVPVDILVTRIENPETQLKLATADVVTARALAPLPRLLGWVVSTLKPTATAVLPKGRDWAAEIEAARQDYEFDARLVPSRTDPEARLVVITALRAKPET